ncbi:hypothetical protein [Bradyrhizobium sp. SSUT77]|uniref:hypothetical protein n=1 Tax=Bradyrhizobium sp. SSUT77 TaxID=3040603 RepID=UPI00244A9BBC|nr:hypothetical protein [Bradyrhizobium sp. SSUT77]MDH2343422.1 hypothetical protein [Bradyrhizobium sp. SSUT77]
MRKSVGLGAALLAMTAATSTFAAQNGCVPNPDAVTSERAIQFLGNPEALLSQFKDGQGGLASQIRDMLTNRPETLEGMGSLAKASSDDQGRAIGAGMGTAAAVCVLTQPQFAQQIQEVVLKTDKPGLIQSFTSITGDIPTEAITGADANGDTTAGGGQAAAAEPRAGGAISPAPPPSFSAGAGPVSQSTTTLFAASTGTSSLTATSPSR